MGSPVAKTVPVAVLGRGEAVEIRLSLVERQGRKLLDCRAFDRFTSTGLYTSTGRGFALPIEQIEALVEAVGEARLAAQSTGLLGGDA